MNVFIVNRSKRISDADAQKMVDAVQIQMAEHVALAWDRFPPKVQLVKADEVKKGYVVLLLDTADDPDALGYHTEDSNGNITGKVFTSPVLDNGGVVLHGKNGEISVASVLSHEVAEQFINPSVDEYVDGTQIKEGSEYAKEVGDPVQGDSYDITLSDGTVVSVSNFVMPNWFDPDASSEFDYCKKVSAPFELSRGGYCVVRNGPGTEQQIFGEELPPEWRRDGERKKKMVAAK